jgi:UDPglucose 6-dehydrogenase
MKITVFGTGYVGLVTGSCFAEMGNEVTCFDIDQNKVAMLKLGISPLYEPGLEELIKKNQVRNLIKFTTDIDDAVANSDVIFIAVGTPSLNTGHADLSQVREAAIEIAKRLSTYKLIVVKSTVPVGTCDQVKETIKQYAPENVSFDVASNPEFLREGSAVKDTFETDRIIIGADSKQALDILGKLYSPIHAPILKVDIRSAEMIKYASNAFLATKISFINEIANVCDKVGADIKQVAQGMGYDHRIGPHFLNAGIGYGGSCFPKDTSALVQIAGNVEYEFKILRAVIEINKIQRSLIIEKLKSILGNLEGKTISVLGLAFKPNTDDLRESPAIDIINLLLQENVFIKAFDPVAMEKSKKVFPHIAYCQDEYDSLNNSDGALILTDWPQFKDIVWVRAGRTMRNRVVIDGRNMFEFKDMEKFGIIYDSIGRGQKTEYSFPF